MTRADRYRLVARFARPHRSRLALLVLLAAGPAVLTALQPLPLKLLVDNALQGDRVTGLPARALDLVGLSQDPYTLVVVAGLAAAIAAVVAVLAADVIALYWETVGARMVRDVSCAAFDHLQRLTPLFHARTPTGDSLSRVTTDSSAVYTAVNALLVAPVMHVLVLAAVGWSAWRMDPSLTLVALAVAPVLALTSRRFSTTLKQKASRARAERVGVLGFVTQIVHSLPVVQAFTAEPDNLRTFRSLSDRSLDASRRAVLAETSAESTSTVIGACGVAVILVAGGHRVLEGAATLGDLVVFLAYIRTLDAQFRSLLRLGRQLRQAEVGLDLLHELLTSDDRISDPPHPVSFPAFDSGAAVEWERVTFGYEPGRPVLRDVSLSVQPAERVALVGTTGAGKSTLVSLVPRLFDPWSGRISIDGVDVRAARVSDVRDRVAVVRQDPLILPASVHDNIAIAWPDATPADVEWAARKALADEFIVELPDGYDTVLPEGGSNLSGGQRQRLAIARAFLKEAPVLVLDEPTSALDSDSESVLMESLARISEGRTVLIIAHRLSTVRSADRTIVLEHGSIVEVGTHDELVASDGTYAAFHRLHAIESPT